MTREAIQALISPEEVESIFGEATFFAFVDHVAKVFDGAIAGLSLQALDRHFDRLDLKKEGDGRATLHVFLSVDGRNVHLWGYIRYFKGKFRGKVDGHQDVRERREVPALTWEGVGILLNLEGREQRLLGVLDTISLERGTPPGAALFDPDPWLTPNELPVVRSPAGESFCVRFSLEKGGPVDFVLVVHDQILTIPLGGSLAAALRYMGRQEGGEIGALWTSAAMRIADGNQECYEQLISDRELEQKWRRKFSFDKGVAAQSEAVCRELLKELEGSGSAAQKSTWHHTARAFACARLGLRNEALDAAVYALSLPARDGVPNRSALAVLDEFGEVIPLSIEALIRSVRSSDNPDDQQAALARAGQDALERGDYIHAYALLTAACFDCGATATPELMEQILQAAEGAGYETIAEILKCRLGKREPPPIS